VQLTPGAPWAEAAIEAASSWARRFLRRPELGVAGTTVEKYFHVSNNGYVPTEGQPTAISVVTVPGESPQPLDDELWEYDGEGVRLFPNPDIWWVDEVTVDQSGDIDPLVRDGVAVAAAALMTRAPRLAKGLNAERIGDYSYTLTRIETSDPWFEQAKSLMRPMRRVPDLVP
jgi:hypothetical protein